MKEKLNEKLSSLEHHFEQILKILGMDLSHPSYMKTPERIAKMYAEELFYGLDPDRFPTLSYDDFITPETDCHLVTIKNIAVQSMCLHHFMPFTGTCTIAYIPQNKVLGLSKINRIVDYFCHRPQLQEKLTQELLLCFTKVLETDDVSVKIKAKHHCVTMRGIRDLDSETITEASRGKLQSFSIKL